MEIINRIKEVSEREREEMSQASKEDTLTEWHSKPIPKPKPKPQKPLVTTKEEVKDETGNVTGRKKLTWVIHQDSVDSYVEMKRPDSQTSQSTTPTAQSGETKIRPGYANLSFPQSGQSATEQDSTPTFDTQAPPLTTDGEAVKKTKRYINIDMDDPEADILAAIASAKASWSMPRKSSTARSKPESSPHQ